MGWSVIAELIGIVGRQRLCGSWPVSTPPGREFSRFSFLSVDGGLDEVRDVLSGRRSWITGSINSSLLRRCKFVRSMRKWIQRLRSVATGKCT
jgi:hypothetical protein